MAKHRARPPAGGAAKDPIRKDTDVNTPGASDPTKDVVTEGSEESFPASDPPSFMGCGSIAGSPPSSAAEITRATGRKDDKAP